MLRSVNGVSWRFTSANAATASLVVPCRPPPHSSHCSLNPHSVTCYQVPQHPAAKIIEREACWKRLAFKNHNVCSMNRLCFLGCFSPTLPSKSNLNHTPAAICEVGPAEAGRDRDEERSDETMMSAGECSAAAKIRLPAPDDINHA